MKIRSVLYVKLLTTADKRRVKRGKRRKNMHTKVRLQTDYTFTAHEVSELTVKVNSFLTYMYCRPILAF